jgi:hypothetical protein
VKRLNYASSRIAIQPDVIPVQKSGCGKWNRDAEIDGFFLAGNPEVNGQLSRLSFADNPVVIVSALKSKCRVRRLPQIASPDTLFQG